MRGHATAWLMVALCGAVAAAPGSLVRDGGFEASQPGALSLAWQATGDWAVDRAVAHSGNQSLRARVAPDSPRTDAFAVQNLPARPGATYTCAVWMRTDDVRPLAGGGFAFAAIYQFDDADQIVAFQDFARVTGARDWARHTYTFTVDARAERAALHCGLYQARGTAWFDDFVVTKGKAAPAWSPDTEAREMAQQREAAVAIFKDDIPACGAASSPDDLAGLLREAGIQAAFLDADGLADPAQLNVERFDIVALPYGASFPVAAASTFRRFLAAGGDFISVGGYAFDDLLENTPDGWRPYQEGVAARSRTLPLGGDFEGEVLWKTDTPRWAQIVSAEAAEECESETPRSARGDSQVAHSGRRSARIRLPVGEPAAGEWYQDFAPTPGKVLRITAWVKASAVQREAGGFAFAAVYQFDAQGRRLEWRDFAVVTGTQDWQRYQYEFAPAPGCVRIRLRLGLYDSSGVAWFDDVTVTEREPAIRMNTRHGDPKDGLHVSQRQIGVFDPTYCLKRAAYAAAAPDGPLDSNLRWEGPLEGYAACAVTGDDHARWMPLINAYDRFGRLRGAVGSLTRHYAGPYRGSSWACFGVTSQDVFARGAARDAFVPLVRHMLRETYLHNVATHWACYRKGEDVSLSVRVSNFGRQGREEVVPLVRQIPITREGREEDAIGGLHALGFPVPSGATHDSTVGWRASKPGLYRVEVELREGKEVIDRFVTGCVVRDPDAPVSGPQITWQDNYLTLDGKPRFLLGTDTYSNMFSCASHNPWTWHQAARKMRAHQVLVFENLQVNPEHFAEPYVADERFLRQAAAMALIAQRHGLIYDAGLLIGFNVLADDDTLAKQAAWCRQWASRMADVPGLLHYINGDLQLTYAKPDQPDHAGQAGLWHRWLREKHADIEALDAAWQSDEPFAAFEDIPLAPATPRGWDDLRARDRRLFENAMVQRWLGALHRALKEADPAHPTTVEFYQMPWTGIDPRAGLDGLDIGNIGYFGLKSEDIAKFPATFAFTDLRVSGQGLSVGEFGVKTHPAWESVRNYHTARSQAEQFDLFLAVPHYAFGLGGCKVQNWCWEDADEYIFPWGLNYPNDRVAKDVLDVYRNVGLLLGRFEPVYRPPAAWLVVPTSHRMSRASDHQVYDAVLRAIDALIGAHVPFAVIGEDRLDLLPPEAKALFWPVPFCPSDAAYQVVLDFARHGGTVYLSGDFSFDPDRKRTRTHRLEELAGVRFAAQRFVGLAAGKATRVEGAEHIMPGIWEATPCISVEPADAGVIARSADVPVLMSHRVGDGQVIFTTDIPEARPNGVLPHALYRAVLKAAGVERIAMQPDATSVHLFGVPTREGGTVYVLYNASRLFTQTVTITTPHGRFALTLGPHKPGLVALSREGRLLAVQAAGEVTRDGKPVASGDCHFAWFTDGETDLTEAQGSILTTLTPGRVRVNAPAINTVRACGWDAGGWRVLEEVEPQRDGAWLTIQLDDDLARQPILLGDAVLE